MDRVDFYYKQLVTDANMDQVFDYAETADQNLLKEHGAWGVVSGLVVTEAAVPDLTVLVSAGVAYDELGRRIYLASQTAVDLSTYVPGSDARIVHIYAAVDRTLSDSRLDGYGASINYQQAEGCELVVVAGAIGAPPDPPALVADQVLIAEVIIATGETTIVDADISSDFYIGQRQSKAQAITIPAINGEASWSTNATRKPFFLYTDTGGTPKMITANSAETGARALTIPILGIPHGSVITRVKLWGMDVDANTWKYALYHWNPTGTGPGGIAQDAPGAGDWETPGGGAASYYEDDHDGLSVDVDLANNNVYYIRVRTGTGIIGDGAEIHAIQIHYMPPGLWRPMHTA